MKEFDRFLEWWWIEFKETLFEKGFSQYWIDSLDPENFRFYYNHNYSPFETCMMGLHCL